MQTSTYAIPVRKTEQGAPKHPSFSHPNAFHAVLLKQALLRDHVQSAISELIRNYEATSGSSVVRLHFHPDKKKVSLDAIPTPSAA